METIDTRGRAMRSVISRTLVIALGCAALAAPQVSLADDSAAAAGKALSNPLSDIWALFTEIDYTFSNGDLSDKNYHNGQAVIFQPIMPFPLTDNWKMLTRPTLPIIVGTDVPNGRRYDTIDLPGGDGVILKPDGNAVFDSEDGFGDMSLPLLFSPKSAGKWGWGAGPTFLFPTGDEPLTTDTWEVGPAAVVTYKTPGFTGAVMGQYWWNYAEQDNDTPDTSHGSLLYSAWWNLPNAWQVGMNPTITYNNETRSDDKWNVPVGFGVAKTIKWGKMPIKFQFSVEKSIVREDDFGKDWNIRFNIIPVIPGLVQKPLF